MDARKRLFGFILANKWYFVVGIVLGAAASSLDIYILTLLKQFSAAAIGASVSFGGMMKQLHHAHAAPVVLTPKELALRQHYWAEIRHVVVVFLLLQLPKAFAAFGGFYGISAATNRIATQIRDEVYGHIHRMSLSFFERNKIGHLMSRMTNDVALIQNGAAAVIDCIQSPTILVLGIAYMFLLDWRLTLTCLIFAPGMSWVMSKVTHRIRKLTTSLQLALADVAALLEETIAGVRIVKSFGMEDYEVRRFARENNRSLRAALSAARRNAAVGPATEAFGGLALAAGMLAGGYQMVHGRMTFGDFCVFIAVGIYVSNNVKKVARLGAIYHQTMAGAERIFEVLDEKPDMSNASDAIELDRIEGCVEFRDISFSYQTGEQVLSHISLMMEPGKAVAVVGPSGAGKSTIADLIPRFYDVSSGAVLVDGHDVRSIKIESLRSHIGIVPQETILFSGTIRDNIAYGRPDATDEEVEQAARAANAHEFITQFEDGYNTVIGERGVRLSGGERQRISIARAILKDPRILILDEATSSLDATSERLVQEALESLMRGRTTLVIAHRLSTITKADEIVVLRGGSIAEHGSFSALMAQEGLFAKLYRSQFDLQTIGAAAGTGTSEATLDENQG